MLLTFLQSSASLVVIDLGLLYAVVQVARRLGPRSFEVFILGMLAVLAIIAGFLEWPNQLTGVLGMIFIGYMIVIRDKLVAARIIDCSMTPHATTVRRTPNMAWRPNGIARASLCLYASRP